MKKIIVLISILSLGCSAKKNTVENSNTTGLYEVLTSQSNGGASIQFYEILTEEDEIRMLLGDETLRSKISPNDMKNSTIVILNMGEKPTGGFSISVKDVQEKSDKIILTVQENSPDPGSITTMGITNPYTVVKINSKKKIEIN